MHNKLLFVLTISIFFIFGCSSTTGNIPYGYTPGPEKGIIVISLTSSGECGNALFIDIRRLDKKMDITLGMQDMYEKRDWTRNITNCFIEDQDYSGKLKVIALDAGIYEIYNFQGISSANVFSSSNNFSMKFKVTTKNVIYLGNAHFAIGKNNFKFSIHDMRDRDLDLFERKYPYIQNSYIIHLLNSRKDIY